MKHNPDCEFWHDQYDFECTCGLTRQGFFSLEPWTDEKWKVWVDDINVGIEKLIKLSKDDLPQ